MNLTILQMCDKILLKRVEKKGTDLNSFENCAFTGTLRLKTKRTVHKYCTVFGKFVSQRYIKVSNSITILNVY